MAGASARREHERRRAAREQRVRESHPRLAGLILGLQQAPQHEARWQVGAAGEEHVARLLEKNSGPDVVLLHDRRIPGSRANIDHLAVAPSGVWVIDAKRYGGKVEVRRGALRIAGRDRSKLIVGLARQVDFVSSAVEALEPYVPVHGVLCFVDADLPLLRTLRCGGYPLMYPKRLAGRINAKGAVSTAHVNALAAELAERFRPA